MSRSNNKNYKKKKRLGHYLLALEVIILILLLVIAAWMIRNDRDKKEATKAETETEVSVKEEEVQKTPEQIKEEKIREQIEALTLEEKVAQLFMVTPEQLTGVETVVAAGDATKQAIENCPVGGIIYFAKNIQTPDQVKQMLANTQQYSIDRIGVPVLLSVDEEGGQVVRIANNSNFSVPTFPYLSEIGQSGDTQEVKEVGSQIGAYLKELGFNMDQAPDADVISNPENEVVKYRSFSSDPDQAAEMAGAYLEGLNSQGIIGVYKHFPGHGGTTGDTHEGYAYVESTLDELRQNDLIPFKKGIEDGLRVIMAGHISCPNVTGDSKPAILSTMLITDILREEMGFDGIIITDALDMGAITEQYTPDEAAVEALKAGVDMLLMPADFRTAYQGVLTAVQTGEFTEERIDESVYRIWKVKTEIQKTE